MIIIIKVGGNLRLEYEEVKDYYKYFGQLLHADFEDTAGDYTRASRFPVNSLSGRLMWICNGNRGIGFRCAWDCRSGWHHSTDHFKMSIEYIELVGEGWVVSRDTAQLHFVSLLLGITNIVFTSIGLVDNNWNKNRKCWKYSATTDTIFFIITNFFPPHQM